MASSGRDDDEDTKVYFDRDRFARQNTHRVGVDVEEGGEVEDALEEGGEVHDILEEGREDVEEGGEVPKVPFMGLYSKLFSVPDSVPTRSSVDVEDERDRAAILKSSRR